MGRFQLFRDCYIHINEAFKALLALKAQTVHTGSFGPLLGSYADLEGSLTRVYQNIGDFGQHLSMRFEFVR